MAARRLGVIDTTFRSLVHLRPPRLATMGHLVPILELMDGVGFRAIDALGDMTFGLHPPDAAGEPLGAPARPSRTCYPYAAADDPQGTMSARFPALTGTT